MRKKYRNQTTRLSRLESRSVSRAWATRAMLMLLCCIGGTVPAFAEEQVGAGLRWFEVEVLVFKQTPQYHSDQEQFPLQIQPIPVAQHLDLLSQHRDLINGQREPSFAGLYLPCVQLSESNLPASAQHEDFDTREWLPILTNYRVDSQTLTTQLQSNVLCRHENDMVFVDAWVNNPTPSAVTIDTGPREVAAAIIDGPHGDMYRTRSPFLLPASDLQLTALRDRLANQSGKRTLLHTAWRQPVSTRNQGHKLRLFGGENFSRDYDYLGFAREHYLTPLEPTHNPHTIVQPDNPLMRIERLLHSIEQGQTPFTRPDTQTSALPEQPEHYPANLPHEAWELDGLMHIYLVGNYLHVHGEFNLREEVDVPLQATSLQAQADAALRERDATQAFLQAYYFDQIRRVISHETHYLDHPHLGIVVQIRRTDLSARR